jgi:hypothetical protein
LRGMMKNFIAAGVTAAILTACGGAEQKIAQLESRLGTLEAEVKRLDEQALDISTEHLLNKLEKIALLKPGDQGYSAVRFDLGIVTVKIADIKPYASGSKVSLEFGNLSSARIDGLKAQIEWGKMNERGFPSSDGPKSQEFKFNSSLSPGAWTQTVVVLDSIPPADLGFIRLKNISHTGIVLRK